MKVLLLVLLLAVALCGIVEDINNANVGWKAKEYERFKGMTMDELRALFRVRRGGDHKFPAKEHAPRDLPVNFDPRTQWPNCIHPIRDQAHCGSCWAFGASESLSDRFCIQKQVDVILSPQELVSCDDTDYGCAGGWLETAWAYMEDPGLPTEACLPYVSGGGTVPACTSTCTNGTPKKYYHARDTNSFYSVNSIMTELYTNGPCEAAFDVYQDFITYKTGVYKHITGQYLGGHAIKMLGWGVENGEDYWLCANSWNTSWGDKGFFKILKGSDECGIEDDVVAGMAGNHD
jgi:cathepsin B